MEKTAFFFIDDVIWCLRDIAREEPKSIFDNPFLKMLKKGHDNYGMTVQLNLFYRTDFFYGEPEEFTLSQMPDTYKSEFEESSSWLKFAFHAKQEFPDYPYVNISYETAKQNYMEIANEVKRFAGEKSFSDATILHWGAMSKEGCRALKDCGLKFLSPSVGKRTEFTGDDSVLPYGHAARLRQSRKPEAMLFVRDTLDKRIVSSICSYNYINEEQQKSMVGKNVSIADAGTGLLYKLIGSGCCINTHNMEQLKDKLTKLCDNDYIGVANHEQYFYPDYYAYQSDYADKIYYMAKFLTDNGYRFITSEEFK